MIDVNLINTTPYRMVYSFYLRNDIKSIFDDLSYKMHLICLKEISDYIYETYDEVYFIISSEDINSTLISELKMQLSNIFIKFKSIELIVENDNKEGREGYIFKKYILDKLNDYDGLTLFFHNKRMMPTYTDVSIVPVKENITYWIIGQYFFNMFYKKEQIGSFLRNKNKLIFGWPYMHDNYHQQWLIGGNCFWMKCKEIYKYINENNLENKQLSLRCVSEFYFPEILNKDVIEYPCSNIIKEYIELEYPYEPSINNLFYKYLTSTLPYNNFVQFENFYNSIMNILNE